MSSTIRVQGARVHNLKNLSVEIPRDQLVVFTGLSGSGKSSLAFDTIYAEGQRRYVESLSAYARQFLGQMDKPDVDFIEGLSPAISIDQKTASRNPRSTVGTITEIHDYLRLLFARIGVPYCPNCGKAVSRQTPQQIVDQVMSRGANEKFLVLATVVEGRKGEYSTLLGELAGQGFSRVRVDGVVPEPADRDELTLARYEQHTIDVVLDRLTVRASNRQRLTESVEAALKLTKGLVSFLFLDDDELVQFSEKLACSDCGISFTEMAPRDFSFNSPYGACAVCTGLGTRFEVDPELVVPDNSLSLADGALAPWAGQRFKYFERLIEGIAKLERLRDLGNSVIVVEHDEETIRLADFIVDIGPGAGEFGGRVVHAGSYKELLENPESLTGQYLSGQRRIEIPATRRKGDGKKLTIKGARANNLQNVTVQVPLGDFVAVTGVSGSGKSTLINAILLSSLERQINGAKTTVAAHDTITGLENIDKVVAVNQQPIGRTPRSNPATYTGVFDKIRKLFAETQESKIRGYQQGRFSFNVKGGRCETCAGDGTIKIEMHFLPDVYVNCEVCDGARYHPETLEILYRGKSISDVLNMPITEAVTFFERQPSILRHIQSLVDVGLGYVRLGQPAPTLSGGEAQRVKLATELARRPTGHTFYVLDEPTTGLHFEDVHRLLAVLHRLVDQGNTVLVIEHNLDVIKTADWIIDLGPEGGRRGGLVVGEGTPEAIAKLKTATGTVLREVLEQTRGGS